MIQSVVNSLPFIVIIVVPVIDKVDDELDAVFSRRADNNVKSLKSIYARVVEVYSACAGNSFHVVESLYTEYALTRCCTVAHDTFCVAVID